VEAEEETANGALRFDHLLVDGFYDDGQELGVLEPEVLVFDLALR
jgi:hypothetical protein